MPNLFLSYSRKDLPVVQQLEQALQANGHTVWRDLESIRGGEHWPKAIGKGIAANDFFVLAWSLHSAQSHFVEFEWNTALALKKIIIPCLLDDTALPPSLRAINGIHFQDFANGVSALLKSLQQSLPDVAPAQQAKVLAKLQTLKTEAPEKVVTEAKAIFAQHGWNVQGNVYQAAGDIHVTLPPPAEAPKKKLLEKWQTWVGLIGGILAILAALTELPEKVVKMTEIFWSKPEDSIENAATATMQVLAGQIQDENGRPLPGVIVTLPDHEKTDTTNTYGRYRFEILALPFEPVKLQAFKPDSDYEPINRDVAVSGKPDTFQMQKIGRNQ